jgi:hypothetical protein
MSHLHSPIEPSESRWEGRSPSPYVYVGPAILRRVLPDSSVRGFRGRVVRHEVSGAYRFHVNRTRGSKVPAGWPEEENWTDDFDVKDVEWLCEKPEGV